LIRTTIRRNKKHATSSFFDDIRLLRRSRFDTDYRDLKNGMAFDVGKLQLAYAAQEIILWRRGCMELSDYINRLPNDQLKDLVADYMGEDWTEDKEPVAIETHDKFIADPDNEEA